MLKLLEKARQHFGEFPYKVFFVRSILQNDFNSEYRGYLTHLPDSSTKNETKQNKTKIKHPEIIFYIFPEKILQNDC